MTILLIARDTYENAPVFTLIEKVVIQASLNLMGYPFRSDGIMTPSDTVSIMYAMIAARHTMDPLINKQGMNTHIPTLSCFTSECGYNSVMTAAHWLGIGIENVYTVLLLLVKDRNCLSK